MMRVLTFRLAIAYLVGTTFVWAVPVGIPTAEWTSAPPRTSPPYSVTVTFQLESPFVPDGRASIAELAFRVVFAPVIFEFDPEADPLLGRCQLETGKVKGVFSRFVLNDVQRGEDRRTPAFLTPRPAGFTAGLAIESEPTADDESTASRTVPDRVRLSFWTDFGGAGPVKWGTALGTGTLDDLQTVFEVPFRDLLAGRAWAVAVGYEGKYIEDKGTWKIEFMPRRK